MNYPLFALGLGFLLGLKHATEADHLVAVTTIVSEQRSVSRSALVGAMWGVGHTAALFAAGVVVILLEVTIPERVAAALEFGVALMIIFLGSRVLFLTLRRRRRVHAHAHTHGGRTHTHLHFHEDVDAHAATDEHAPPHERHGGLVGWRPLAVGAVHGLAGSAALTLLVLAEVLRNGSRTLGLAYLLIFGVGSIGGMMLMSALISLPFVFTASRFQRIDAPVRLLTGFVSVAFGLYYAWETAGGL
ncbi:MAG: urease accessory protein UreH [Acidobacteria bacterium]|nr:MAG: urease accessory protein UreH [Acidobacteriota bacterium]